MLKDCNQIHNLDNKKISQTYYKIGEDVYKTLIQENNILSLITLDFIGESIYFFNINLEDGISLLCAHECNKEYEKLNIDQWEFVLDRFYALI